MDFRSLNYTYLGKTIIRGKPMMICFFLTNLRNGDLRIKHSKFTDLRTGTPKKFTELRLPNEPKNLGICVLTKKFAYPPLKTRYIFSLIEQEKRFNLPISSRARATRVRIRLPSTTYSPFAELIMPRIEPNNSWANLKFTPNTAIRSLSENLELKIKYTIKFISDRNTAYYYKI
jgi:hypothetical protein